MGLARLTRDKEPVSLTELLWTVLEWKEVSGSGDSEVPSSVVKHICSSNFASILNYFKMLWCHQSDYQEDKRFFFSFFYLVSISLWKGLSDVVAQQFAFLRTCSFALLQYLGPSERTPEGGSRGMYGFDSVFRGGIVHKLLPYHLKISYWLGCMEGQEGT